MELPRLINIYDKRVTCSLHTKTKKLRVES